MKEKSEGYLKKFRKIKSLKNVDSFELNEKILAGADIKDA